QLLAKGLIIESSVSNCAGNQLVVIAGKGQKISQFSDLLKVDRISIGDPKTVPAGMYALEALEKANVYEALRQKQKLVFAENALQAVTYVESGDVDAGIVYNTDALLARESKICFSVPLNYTSAMVYKIAILKSSQNTDSARAFIACVLSDEGRKLFRAKGFVI
ncbi:MAG: molybdate ABC transporter substrate-binding protein, partial [Candidatus Obscuribacterales bacterium]|nr:molybdate ABC transporter substrate-binding protein [Candidatus Obscuribacterales bacterium]